MVAKRRTETLEITDITDITDIKHLDVNQIHRLMQLAIAARTHSYEFNPGLATAYGKLTAECQFELWSRRQRAKEWSKRACGRSVSYNIFLMAAAATDPAQP
jgi:hypothetical protein